MIPRPLPRRTVLRGSGVALALPFLDAMASRARAAGAPPVRMAFLYLPNGAIESAWQPDKAGALGKLPPTLEPLQAHRDRLLVVSGLAHREGDSKGDGGGGHTSASSVFLTAAHSARQTPVFRVGVSVDQVAAQRIGHLTRLPSLELTCDRGRQAGICDSGDACAYLSNISWKTPTTPMPPEVDPRLVFERLFGDPADADGSAARARIAQERSVLDFVHGRLARLASRTGKEDRARIDEFATSVREIEAQIERAERTPPARVDEAPPSAIPPDYGRHLRVMMDLLALAFRTDTTRIATFILAQEESNRSYPFIDVPEGHHDLSHHGGDAGKQAKVAKINRFHMTQVGHLLDRLAAIREGDSSLLDRSMIVCGSGMGDGDKHAHYRLPTLVAGRGGGTIATGRHLVCEQETPMANLFVAMLDRVGAPVERFGDSTGPLALR